MKTKLKAFGLTLTLCVAAVLQCTDVPDSDVDFTPILLSQILAANTPCSNTAVSMTLGESRTFTEADAVGPPIIAVPAGATSATVTNTSNSEFEQLTVLFRAAQCQRPTEELFDVGLTRTRAITIPQANLVQLNMFYVGDNPTSYSITVKFD